MFHSYADGYWTGTSRADLAALVESHNMRHIEEMGDHISWTTFSGVDPNGGWGAVVKSREYSNIYLSDINMKLQPILFWSIHAALFLPIIHWIVVNQAATDNLTELMARGGDALSSLFLGLWIA